MKNEVDLKVDFVEMKNGVDLGSGSTAGSIVSGRGGGRLLPSVGGASKVCSVGPERLGFLH